MKNYTGQERKESRENQVIGNNIKRLVRMRMRKSTTFGNEAAKGPSKEGTRVKKQGHTLKC